MTIHQDKYRMEGHTLYIIPTFCLPELAEIFFTHCAHSMVRLGGGFNHALAGRNNTCTLDDDEWASAWEAVHKLIDVKDNHTYYISQMQRARSAILKKIKELEKLKEAGLEWEEMRTKLLALLKPTSRQLEVHEWLKNAACPPKLQEKIDAILAEADMASDTSEQTEEKIGTVESSSRG